MSLFNKWVPDNILYKEYNNYLICLAEQNRLKYNLENVLIPKSKQLIKEFMKKSKSFNQEEKNQVQNIRKEMNIMEQKILFTEKSIKKYENMDVTVIEKWKEYNEKAQSFLTNNNIDCQITANDILTNESLYLMYINFLKNNYNQNLKIIQDINIFFDLDTVEKILSKNNQLTHLKKNLIDIIENTSEFYFQNHQNKSINYELNVENKLFELSDEIIHTLCQECNLE
jgi:hypothetical protein